MTEQTAYGFAEARMRCGKFMPYIYKNVACLIPVKRPGLGTMAVDDRMRVYYDPAVFAEWPIDKATFVILHEAMHVILRHGQRCRAGLGENPTLEQLQRWNIAADAAVNYSLRQCRLPIPKDAIMPATLGFPDNLVVEDYYRLLLEQADQQQTGQNGEESQPPEPDVSGSEPSEGQQECHSEAQEPPEGPKDPKDGPDSEAASEAPGDADGGDPDGAASDGMAPGEAYDGDQPSPGGGSGGSCADGQPRPWECPAEEAGGPAEMSEFDQKMVERAVAEDIERYEREKGIGSTPGSLSKLAASILRPKVDPFKQLAAAVKYAVTVTSGCGDYTWKKLPRRSPPGACRLPASVQPVPRATVIIDTSASMNQDDLAKALGVVQQGLRSVPTSRLRVMVGGTRVEGVQNVMRVEDVELLDGGGTDMAALIEAAADERPTPDAIIVLSDGGTGWGSRVVPRVVVCLTTKPWDMPPDWITTVKLYEEDE